MKIVVECKGCHRQYKVDDSLGGRVAECKYCGQKFRVPYRSPVVRLGDGELLGDSDPANDPTSEPESDDVKAPGETADVGSAKESAAFDPKAKAEKLRTFAEYGADAVRAERLAKKMKAQARTGEPLVPLPAIVSELWLPLTVTVVGYVITLSLAIKLILSTPGVVAGVIILGLAVVLLAIFVIPMVIKTIEGASMTFEFDLPNAIWLQTAALVALPTTGLAIGFFNGHFAGMIAGGLIGITFMIPLMALLHQAPILKSLQAGIMTSLIYVLTIGGSIAVALGLGLVLPNWGLNLPWRPLPPEPLVATAKEPAKTPSEATPSAIAAPVTASTPPASEVPPVAPPAVAAAATATGADPGIFSETPATPLANAGTPAPVVAAAVTPSPVVPDAVPPEPAAPAVPGAAVKDELKWTPAVDAPPLPVNWPLDAKCTLTVQPPVSVVGSVPPGAFVALIDRDSCDIYDVRAGKRVGSIAERFNPARAILSARGRFLAAQRISPGVRRNTGPEALSRAEIWSCADARLASEIGGAAGIGRMRIIGFAGDDRVVTTGETGSRRVVQVWDAPSGQVIRTFDAELGSSCLISINGRYLASLENGLLRMHDLESGRPLGESQLPGSANLVRAMAFSPDGSALAAVVGETPLALRIVVWDLRDGKLAQDLALESPPPPEMQDELHWLPDGSGFLYGVDMLDRATGRMFYRLAPQTLPGTEGRPRSLLSYSHVLYEHVPSGSAEKVVYRSVALPRGELNSALRMIRGPSWNPDDDSARARTAASAPSSRPALADLARQKEWVVLVVVVRKADVNAIAKQIDAEREKLPDIDKRIRETRAYADKLASEVRSETVNFGRDRDGRRIDQKVNKKVHSDAQIGNAAVAADRAADERRKVNAQIARLNRERTAAETTRTVVAKLEDGTPLEIDVTGTAMVVIADGLQTDSRWRVAGAGRIVDQVLHVTPRAITTEAPE